MMSIAPEAVCRYRSCRVLLYSLLVLLPACSEVPATGTRAVQPHPAQLVFTAETLKVLSLNIAHGRKDGINQLFLSSSTIRNNLDGIATVLGHSGADIVALQEADAASRWSGSFDHVAVLAGLAGYPVVVHSLHASGWLFNYGTAILSRAAFTESLDYTFEPSLPTLNKGFTLAQFAWQPNGQEHPPMLLDIVSVHLDFSRQQVRERQVREISRVLDGRDNPTIILGDFNSDWLADEQVIRTLARENNLKAYRPAADDLGTFPSGNKRLDWILISDTLDFINYTVLPDVLSDHKAVIAEIGPGKRTQPAAAGPNRVMAPPPAYRVASQ
jgi:endonuclease/exonuclease/phosphatase family metal-dependent hydrolase